MKTGQRNNKGFSLVELIIVIAIMAILAGSISLGVGSIVGSKVNRCAQSIQSVIEKVRVTTMGKSAVKLTIYKDSNGNYYAKQEIVSKKTTTNNGGSDDTTTSSSVDKIGESSVFVAYALNTDSADAYTVLEAGDAINLEFDRSSGALKTDDTGEYVKYIYIYNAKQTRIKRIQIYMETGNIEMTSTNKLGAE